MKVDQINIYEVLLPFSGNFAISRLEGLSSKTVVVEVLADHGEISGYGEGLPIQFVTGETPASVIKDIRLFAKKDSFPWELNDVSKIWDFVSSLPTGKEHNAAICAVEMALLDALGKSQGRYIIDYFPKDYATSKVHYGAVITLGDKERITELSELIRDLGIKHLRIKLGKDFGQNKVAIETVGSVFGANCDLRIDPNAVWDRDTALKHIPLIREYKVKVVEEPMVRDSAGFEEFAEMMRSMGVMLMACESAPTLSDVKRIISEGYYQIVNVKLSRSGGFRRSLRIIEDLRNSEVSFQIGCTLGESGLLSAAGRVLCLLCRDATYYDGSYDEFILRENVTVENVSFGPGGEAGPLEGPGLGVELSTDSLKRLSTDCVSITG